MVTAGILLVLLFVVFFPWPEKRMVVRQGIENRIDERTIMFSRAELEPGTKRFEEFYAAYPQYREVDDQWRKKAGLLQSGTNHYHPLVFPAADATFFTVEGLHAKTEGPVTQNPQRNIPEYETFLFDWMETLGVHSVGVTELKPQHLYSTGGRKHNYGKTIRLNHRFALAFTVEMDHQRVKAAPKGSIVFESSRQYLRAAEIAVQVAAWLRNLGFEAKAHIDGKYDVRCPQVARDAGLGEIGRMGLLMTPGLGPRVRIGVVTTNADLTPGHYQPEASVIRFCEDCKKCAVNCPAQAISHGERKSHNGALEWTIDQEKCFSYWCQAGTDCGRCIAVCPYSHKDNLLHNVVRYFIKHAPVFRKIALLLDDVIYGRKPKQAPLPAWMKIKI